jgi:predicted unusual protein kinase regulating ubiquinone biosynthesis (AarF/ABC1/UbiB family)
MRSSCWLILAALLGCLLPFPCLAEEPAPQLPSAAEVEKIVAERYGNPVPRSKVPALYRELDRAFAPLDRAQQEMVAPELRREGWRNSLTVIDSPALNAFVASTAGSPGIENRVYVTTGLLHRFLSSSPEGLEKIAGILAHELAHPLDKIDPEGFSKGYIPRSVLQAQEIRADAEGALILRRAGYRPESLLLALEDISRSGGEFLEGAVSSHPEDSFRLSSQRLLLTLNRHFEGLAEVKPPAALSRTAERELAELSGKWRAGAGFSELIIRGEELLARQDSSLWLRWLAQLDSALHSQGARISSEEKRSLATILGRFAEKDGSFRFGGVQKRHFLEQDAFGPDFRNVPTHPDLLDSSPFYRDPEVVAAVQDGIHRGRERVYQSALEKGAGSEEAARAAAKVAEEHVLGKAGLLLPLEEALQAFPELRESMVKSGDFYFDAESSRRRAFRLMEVYVNHFSDRKGPEDLARLVFSGSLEPLLFPSGLSYEKREALSFATLSPREQEVMRRFARLVWEEKGRFGILSLVSKYSHFHWPLLADALGIEHGRAKAQLLAAAKEFTSGPAYVEFMESLRKAEGLNLNFPETSASHLGSQAFDWSDRELQRYFAGVHNPHLDRSSDLAKMLEESSRKIQANAFPASALEAYRAELRELLHAGSGSWENLPDLNRKWSAALEGTAAAVELPRLLVEEIPAGSGRDQLVRRVYLDSASLGLNRSSWAMNEGGIRTAVDQLQRSGYAPDPVSVLLRLASEPGENYPFVIQAVNHFHEELKSRINDEFRLASDGPGRQAWLERWGRFLQPTWSDMVSSPELRASTLGPRFREIQAHLFDRPGLPTGPDALRLFLGLAEQGATPELDRFLVKQVLEAGDWKRDPQLREGIEKALREMRIYSPRIQAELAPFWLERKLTRPPGRAKPEQVAEAVKAIEEYVTKSGPERDKLLEELAWKWDLKGSELRLVEDAKALNWRKIHPLFVNLGSEFSGMMNQLDRNGLGALVRYAQDPLGHPFPEQRIQAAIEKSFFDGLLLQPEPRTFQATSGLDLAVKSTNSALQAGLAQASPVGRVPLIELSLAKLRPGFPSEAAFQDFVIREFLAYAPGSTEEKLLRAYLKIVPRHETLASLAYLISQKAADKSSVVSLFEVFQTVGIKFGQMGAVWNLFGDEVSREAARLKDSATPMTKAQVEEVLSATLSARERARVSGLVEVVGSASLKTVVRAKLTDGSEAVLLVQRPHAQEQVAGNLALSLRFLEEIRKSETLPSGMFESVIHGVREQLAQEMNMVEEAARIREASAHYGSLNREGSRWQFAVPDLVEGFEPRRNLLVVRLAEGETVSRLGPRIKAEVGEEIVRSSLRLLFRHGWFDPDRHSGNFLVDEGRKLIQPIDFGQAVQFRTSGILSTDDRSLIVEFFEALERNDPREIARTSWAMRNPGIVSSASEEGLRRAAEESLARTARLGTKDRLVDLLNSLADRGLRMDTRFSFGAFKGLMLLAGEEYVSPQAFAKIFREETEPLMRTKLPYLARRLSREATAACQGMFRQLARP